MSHAGLQAQVIGACVGRLHCHHCAMRTSQPGFPDLVVIGRKGVLWRELKVPPDTLSAAQRALGSLGTEGLGKRQDRSGTGGGQVTMPTPSGWKPGERFSGGGTVTSMKRAARQSMRRKTSQPLHGWPRANGHGHCEVTGEPGRVKPGYPPRVNTHRAGLGLGPGVLRLRGSSRGPGSTGGKTNGYTSDLRRLGGFLAPAPGCGRPDSPRAVRRSPDGSYETAPSLVAVAARPSQGVRLAIPLRTPCTAVLSAGNIRPISWRACRGR